MVTNHQQSGMVSTTIPVSLQKATVALLLLLFYLRLEILAQTVSPFLPAPNQTPVIGAAQQNNATDIRFIEG